MKFTTTSAIITLISATVAVPITTTSNIKEREATKEFYPTTLSNYFVSTGRVQYNTNAGHIMKFPTSQSDQTTLGTYNIPVEYQNRQCSFAFELDGPSDFTSGSNQFDIFTSQKPATADAASWPSGNLRDHHLGRMQVDPITKKGAFMAGFPTPPERFPCPTGEIAGELVPVGDQVDIYWNPLSGSKGPYFIVHLDTTIATT
jgi:hypothetical protein